MTPVDLERLAEEIQAQHRAQFKRPLEHVPRVPPFACGRCGGEHSRFRDRAHTKPAAWCSACHRAASRAYMFLRRKGIQP